MELYQAIEKILSKYGKELISEEKVINYLSDYQAFGVKGSRNVMKTALQMGYGRKLLEASERDSASRSIILNNISRKLEQEGFKKSLIEYVLNNIGYSLWQQNPPCSEETIAELLLNDSDNHIEIDGHQLNMILVSGGTFAMGATPEQGLISGFDERPSTKVTINNFFILDTFITQDIWECIMGSNDSHFKGKKLPVERVSWFECEEFIKRLKMRTGIDFRLPTEAEWEFAARGGCASSQKKYAGTDDDCLSDFLWYKNNSSSMSHDAKTKKPNELGLYDMSGNISEWCSDWYFNSYSSSGITVDPKGPLCGTAKVYRGGSYADSAINCRVSKRFSMNPNYKNKLVGFRIAASKI